MLSVGRVLSANAACLGSQGLTSSWRALTFASCTSVSATAASPSHQLGPNRNQAFSTGPGAGKEAYVGQPPPSSNHYDALVVGLGAFGSAALYHLAREGLRVAGLERQPRVGHDRGSSHGHSRIIRLAYFEGTQYGPLLTRSYRLFQELQEEAASMSVRLPAHSGRPTLQGPHAQPAAAAAAAAAATPPGPEAAAVAVAKSGPLFLRTGMLDVGAVFERALHSARTHGLQHEVLTGAELNRRFPAYRVPDNWRALYQPDGGILAPERIVQAHCALAQQLGAHVLTGQQVVAWQAQPPPPPTASAAGSSSRPGQQSWSSSHGGPPAVCVTTACGGTYTADALVMAGGPWMGQLVPELKDLCVPERQVVGWFEIAGHARKHFAPDAFPVFVLEEEQVDAGGEGRSVARAYYGFPEHGEQPGFKLGLYRHLRQAVPDPDAIAREVAPQDEAALRAGAAAYFPAAGSGRLLSASACYFTNTPDGHFLVDSHPAYPQVVLVSACSGHGFKMCSGAGQLVARAIRRRLPQQQQQRQEEGPAGGFGANAAPSERDSCELEPFKFSPARPGHAEVLRQFQAAH